MRDFVQKMFKIFTQINKKGPGRGPHHAEGRVDPKVREHQNGFRFWIPQSM
jgi:hypothetical protein